MLSPICATAQISDPASTSTSSTQPSTSQPVNPAATAEMNNDLAAYRQMLDQLLQVAQQTSSDLGRLRIDKWKTDSSNKQQTQSNATSLQRNLTAALPEIIQKSQAAPQDVAPSFKVYRNLNVVYDVLAMTAENAGAFGPKEQYEPLARDVEALDQLRRNFADRLDWLSGVRDTQLVQLRQQLTVAQQAKPKPAATTASETPTPKKKVAHKKKAATPPPTE